jgi:uncharacterized protein YndB with AHSA1/START domain
MKTITIDKDLTVAPERAFAFLAQHESLGKITPLKVTRLRGGDDGDPNGVGSVRKLSMMGALPFEETIAEVVPNERIVYRITKGTPLRDHTGTITFSPSGTGTHVRWHITFRGAAPGVAALIGPVLKGAITKALDKVDAQA